MNKLLSIKWWTEFITDQKCVPWMFRSFLNDENRFDFATNKLTKGELLAYKTAKSLGANVNVGIWTYADKSSRVYFYIKDDIVKIGKYCSIADNVCIFGGGEHGHRLRVSTYPFKGKMLGFKPNPDPISKGPTIIGNDVWIGSHAIVLSGVQVGDGAVIGAGAVVSKNVPPYSIVVGNPAIIVGYRFNQEIIDKLLVISWWNWDEDKVMSSVNDFYLDVVKFANKYYLSS